MKKATTFYHIILDQSGSMSDCINQTLNGLANQRKEILAIANEFPGREIRVGLTVFDHLVELKYRNLSVKELSQMNGFEYKPNGLTALLDAIGMSVSDTERLMVNEDDAAVMVILTDGHENASRTFDSQAVKQMVEKAEGKNWGFMFLGANIDAFHAGSALGFNMNNTMQFATANAAETMRGASAMTSRMKGAYASGMDTGATYAATAFSAVERSSAVDDHDK